MSFILYVLIGLLVFGVGLIALLYAYSYSYDYLNATFVNMSWSIPADVKSNIVLANRIIWGLPYIIFLALIAMYLVKGHQKTQSKR